MPILFNEDVLALSAAAREVPGNPHASTPFRWATGPGVGGVRLEVVRVGKRLFTSRQAIARFLAACNGGLPVATPDPKLANKRKQQIRDAERRVRAAGV